MNRVHAFAYPMSLALGFVQWFAIIVQLESYWHLNAFFAGIVSLILISFPFVGAFVEFFGAHDVWGWNLWLSIVFAFFGPWVVLLIASVLSKLLRYDDQ